MELSPFFKQVKPTYGQDEAIDLLYRATSDYAGLINSLIDDGPDKTYIVRRIRETMMWIETAIVRNADGRMHDEPMTK